MHSKDMIELKRKKILFLEARENLFGHVRQNEAIINALSTFSDVTVLFPDGWLSNIPRNVKYVYHNVKEHRVEKHLSQILISIDYIKEARKLDVLEKYDYIVFATYNIYALFYAVWSFEDVSNRLFVIHHSILDQIVESKLKKIIFSFCKNKLNHISIEKFLSDRLREECDIERNRLYWFPHQLNTVSIKCDIRFEYVAISNSNDEKWIETLLNAETRQQIFRNNDIHILVRSQCLTYDDGYLTIINGRLTDEEYYTYIIKSQVVLIPFEESFQYRMSGTVIDALSNGKKIMGKNIPVINEYTKLYPSICMVGVEIDNLVNNKMNGFLSSPINSVDQKHFFDDHSVQAFTQSFEAMFMGR